jgi:hypothetical protein
MLRNPVAVEKLPFDEFAEIASRQEALQTIFPSLLDIFYHPIFDFFRKTDFFNSHSSSHHLSQDGKFRSGSKLCIESHPDGRLAPSFLLSRRQATG